jgi:T5SS/PEP-CTERM-associated repeat protein
LLVGDSHYNELLVEFGGAFSCTSAVVGRGTSNQVTVTGAGSVFSNAGALVVGAGTFAAGCGFTVSNAAFAHSDRATVAEGHGSSNFVVVTGPGSVWSNAGWLSFGLTGKWNRLTVESGGFLHSGSAAIGVSTSAVGNVATVTGSTWSNAGPLQVGVGGPGNVLLVQAGGRVAAGSIVVGTSNTARGCRIDLQGGTVFAATSLVVNTNAALVGAGTVTVSSAFDNYGTVSVGAPVGQLVVNGVFLQRASGALDLQLGGRQAGSTYDQLFCTMNFGLGGTLRVSRLAGFVPTNSERFQVVAFPNSTGSAFAGVELPPWFSWAVDYSPNTGVFVRVTGVDTATNGVPKAWLVDHGWSTNFDAAALADTDGDHVAAWAEYHAGTDPTNGLSYLGVQSVRTNAGIVIQWPGAADKRYRLERGTNLVVGFGQALKTNIPGVPPMNAETDTTAVGAGPWLYRILIE